MKQAAIAFLCIGLGVLIGTWSAGPGQQGPRPAAQVQDYNDGFIDGHQDDCAMGFQPACRWVHAHP